MKKLFTTNVGSHAWGMNRPDSDVDLFKVYQAPSTDFLLGMRHEGGHQNQDGINDIASYEVGMVVKYTLQNNFNFLIGVMSPIVVEDWPELKTLRELTVMNLSRECYYSINGFYMHNYGHIRNGKLKEDTPKKRNVVGRVLECGIRMLDGKGIAFLKPSVDHTQESLAELAAHFPYLLRREKLLALRAKYLALVDSVPFQNGVLYPVIRARMSTIFSAHLYPS